MRLRKKITLQPAGTYAVKLNPSSANEQMYDDFVVSGSAVLTGDFNITPAGTASKFDTKTILWNANATLAGNSIYIFGVEIPSNIVSSGAFMTECFYNGVAWVVSVYVNASGTAWVASDSLGEQAVTTSKVADDAITLDKQANPGVGRVVVGDAAGNPSYVAMNVDGILLIGDATLGATAKAMAGDATIDKAGVLTIANSAITAIKIADGVVSPTKLTDAANRYTRDITLSFENAAEIGNINFTMCQACEVESIVATVLAVPATDTATLIFKDNGGAVLTGSQVDITTALALGNKVTTTPSANNTFAAGDNLLIEMSKATAELCKVNIALCLKKT